MTCPSICTHLFTHYLVSQSNSVSLSVLCQSFDQSVSHFTSQSVRLLRQISLAHWTTKFPFSLAQEQNWWWKIMMKIYLPQAIEPGFFPTLRTVSGVYFINYWMNSDTFSTLDYIFTTLLHCTLHCMTWHYFHILSINWSVICFAHSVRYIWRHDWWSQLYTQLKQLWNWSLKKIHAWMGLEPMTSAILMQLCV